MICISLAGLAGAGARGLGGSLTLILSLMGRCYSHRLARTQAIGAVDDNLGARRGAAVEDGVLAFGERDFNGLHLRGLSAFAIVTDDPDEE